MNPLAEEATRARRVLVAQARWVLAITVIVVVAAGLYVKLQSPTYKATATVTVSLQTFDGTPVATDMSTEQQIASSSGVASIAAQALGVDSSTILDGLSVTAPTAGQVLEITYGATTAATARQRANAVARAYVTYRNSQAATVTSSGSQLIPTASVLSPARLPSSPAGQRLLLTIAAAVVLGAALGVVVAFVRDWFDDRVRDARDVEGQGLTALGTVPTGAADDGVDDYRRLRDRVNIELVRTQARTLLVAGVDDAAGCADVAVNLSMSLARSGRQVVLVETRPDEDVVHELLEGDASTGLSGLLRDGGSAEAQLRATPVAGLRVMPAGGPLPGAVDRLAGPAMHRVMSELRSSADVVVVETGDVLASTRTLAVAPLADLALLVAPAGTTTAGRLTEAAAELRQARLDVVGCVLVAAVTSTRSTREEERPVIERAHRSPVSGRGR